MKKNIGGGGGGQVAELSGEPVSHPAIVQDSSPVAAPPRDSPYQRSLGNAWYNLYKAVWMDGELICTGLWSEIVNIADTTENANNYYKKRML